MKLIVSVSLAVALMAAPAMAGTTFKANVVPETDFCSAGTCDYHGNSCSTNDDCDFGSLSNKSKVSLTGAGLVKVLLKGVVDPAGAPASGDYILFLYVYGTSISEVFPIKVPVTDGKGKTSADLSTLLPAAGEAIQLVVGNYLYTPPPVPGDCPGAGNSAADITSRVDDADCQSGDQIGYVGVSSGSKKAIKSNISPIADSCFSGHCNWNFNEVCATNADCNFGTMSAKSKVSLTGTGRLKVSVKGVKDPSGMDGAGDYILFVFVQGETDFVRPLVKVTVADGKGTADVDISTLMPPAGEATDIFGSGFYNPPDPLLCTGTNSAADIAAREGDNDCISEGGLGAIGVLTE